MPPSGPRPGVGNAASKLRPNGGSFMPPAGASDGENSVSSSSRIDDRCEKAFPNAGALDCGANAGVAGTPPELLPLESEVDIVRLSLLFLGRGTLGTMKEGDAGSEKAWFATAVVAPAPAPCIKRPDIDETALSCGTAGREAVLFSPTAFFSAGAVAGRAVLIPLVFMQRLRTFLPFLFGDSVCSKPNGGGAGNPKV